MKCIDVEKRFARYKSGYEDPAFVGTQDPWHKVIVCRRGTIGPSGGQYLLATIEGRRSYAARSMLGELGPSIGKVLCEADDGMNVEFHVKDVKYFLQLLGAKRK